MRAAAKNTKSPKNSPETMPVPLLDVARGTTPLRDEILQAVAQVVDSGRFIHGPDVKKLEETVATMSGAKHAIACASGSDALLLALMALDVGPGDEVICPSFTFFATASAAWRLGAKPVFVDIESTTFNIDTRKIEEAITSATKAIIPVHLFGQCADMDEIMRLGKKHGIGVVEDAAQAIGAKYRGRGAGSIGQIGCFSFYPTKNLGGMGDGGLMTTNDDAIADKLRLLAAHGMSPRYYHKVVGINSRLDSIQAAILNVKIQHLDEWTRLRQENAERYFSLFTEAALQPKIGLPIELLECEHVWNQFTIRVPNGQRDALRAQLATAQVGTEVYYPVPLHQQECFRSLGYRDGSLPETERAAKEVLSLPIFPELTAAEQECVVRQIDAAFQNKKLAAA